MSRNIRRALRIPRSRRPSWSCQKACCKKPVEDGYQRRVCGGIIDGTCHNKTVRLAEFRRKLIDNIIKDAFPELTAPSASDAAPDIHIADLHRLGLNALRLKIFSISFIASEVLPFILGLPLIMSTFIFHTSFSYILKILLISRFDYTTSLRIFNAKNPPANRQRANQTNHFFRVIKAPASEPTKAIGANRTNSHSNT